MSLKEKLKFIFRKDPERLFLISEFAHANKDFLIIVCDPKTDRMFATYKDRFVNGKIKSPDGKKTHVVKDVLSYSIFKKSVDSFLINLVETLHLPTLKGNQFYQLIDGFLFAIAKSLRDGRKDKKEKGAVVSPFVKQPK